MKIAFYTTLNNNGWGGSEVLWYNLSLGMVKNGYTVGAFVKKWNNEPKQFSALRENGVEVLYHSKHVTSKNIFNKVANYATKAIKAKSNPFETLIKWEPDFIIFNQGNSYDLGYFTPSEIDVLLSSKIPYLVICHNNSDYNYIPEKNVRDLIKIVFENSTKNLFVADRNAQSAEMALCRKFNNFDITGNSLSLKKIPSAPMEMPQSDPICFASVANLRCSHKGQNLLFHVLSSQKWKNREWKLNLYGRGENEDYLKELSVYLELNDRIFFHGQVDNLIDVWQSNHMMVLASFGEGRSLAIQEAMLCGRPSLVTDVGGNTELITDGITGFVADGTTYAAIDKALERAWDNKAQWAEIGRNAFESALKIIDFKPEDKIRKILELILVK